VQEAIEFVVQMHEWALKVLQGSLADVTPEEARWRPLPQSNNINRIVRHLRIEAQWQLDAIETGKPMPAEAGEELKRMIDSVPEDDFEGNLQELVKSCTAFVEALRGMTLADLEKRGETAYQEFRRAGSSPRSRFLGFHHFAHLIGHLGQISTLRNLYRTTRGEPALSHPDNPTFTEAAPAPRRAAPESRTP
jgi:uncharacterized damage-inducible protein DinB